MANHNALGVYDLVLQAAASAGGAGSPLPAGGLAGACLQVTGTFSATITCQATVDGTFLAVPVYNYQTQTWTLAGTITAAGLYWVPLAGADQFQANITAYTSGSVTVTAKGVGVPGPLPPSLSAGTLGAVNQGTPGTVGNAWPAKLSDGTNTAPLQSAANAAAATNGNGAQVVTPPGNWTKTHAPAVGVQATKSQTAGGAGVRHVCTWLSITLANDSTGSETSLTFNLIDGTTGGTALDSFTISVPATAGACQVLTLMGLAIVGSVNTAMTLECASAPGAHTSASVAFGGYDIS